MLDYFLWDLPTEEASTQEGDETSTAGEMGNAAKVGAKTETKATIKFGTYRRPRGLDLEGIKEAIAAVSLHLDLQGLGEKEADLERL